MHWRTAGLCVLSLVVLTACPEEFGMGGRIDQAAHQDALESIPLRCSMADFMAFCDKGRRLSADCVKHCGKP